MGRSRRRYTEVTLRKSTGATYTPPSLARYLAQRIIEAAPALATRPGLRLTDPALGDGTLALALIDACRRSTSAELTLRAFETDEGAAATATERLAHRFPEVERQITVGDFLDLADDEPASADLMIANPPYVRTQILGARTARKLASSMGLRGRIDLYHAFLSKMIDLLEPEGVMGAITSNRFLTTRGGADLRQALLAQLELHRIWDLGDTKIFDAAVLPAMILGRRKSKGTPQGERLFTSVYQCLDPPSHHRDEVASALDLEGVVAVADGRRFRVRQGRISATSSGTWRLTNAHIESWLDSVAEHTWQRLGDLGKIRVGVKTTADKVFIRDDWGSGDDTPELLRPVITHHVAARFRARIPQKQILYPHLATPEGRAAVELERYPRSARYLEDHRAALEARTYVLNAGRRWYEIWVPQNPALWDRPKMVFRDICDRPTFWIDESGAVVNGDCYWMVTDDPSEEPLLWLALAICNSTFIDRFYDLEFNNKLYAGRRRFISQYVERFPLPDPDLGASRKLMKLSKQRFSELDPLVQEPLEEEIDALTWEVFGLRR